MNTKAKVRTTTLLALFTAASLWAAGAAATPIPNVPLITATSIEPNIMVTLDDSGSMHWEVMPDDITYVSYIYPRANRIYLGSDYPNTTVDTSATNRFACLLRSPHNNTVYYNPAIRYFPWSKEDGSLWPDANPQQAYHNPANPGAGWRNLTVNNTQSAYWLNNNGNYVWQRRTIFPATYFVYNGTGSTWDCNNYTRVEIKPANAPFPKAPGRTDCPGNTCTYAEEIQNFANWYSYHRSRILAARAGVGRAFSSLGSNVRVGFATINQGTTKVDGVNTQGVILGVREFTGTDRTNFFDILYNRPMPVASTPLRRAADDVGQYFSRTDDRGPWSSTPGQNGGTEYSCRQSFQVLTTDGYWNSSSASTSGARKNNDGTNGPTITGPGGQSYTYSAVTPFTDNVSNTLADVAMYYWKRDLHPSLANEVPTHYMDPAFWQHLVTFGIAMGLDGTIDPQTAFDAIHNGTTINWPNPITNSTTARVDDLLHASVNGRGGFFIAKNPKEFADSLRDSLQNIVARVGSGASVVANSTSITTDTLVFQATFNSGNWSGNLLSYQVTTSGVATTPFWEAAYRLPTPPNRKIFITTGGSAQPFSWSNLSAADQALLGNSDVVEYLRGERSKELSNGGTFRNRGTHVLGDIVHSPPFYVKDTDTVFIGANDGMLHAFRGVDGVELFAYIPSAVVPRLEDLSDPAYSHDYYVDGDVIVSSQSQTPNKNYLVATLGRGGKGLFSLDVTTPASFGTSNLRWEYFDSSDNDLGYMLGKLVLAKMNDGSMAVIAANGYNSDSGEAVLYVFDLATGNVIRKIGTGVSGNNGLSSPAVLDTDNDGDVDFIYAGDLKGNVWKFDVTDSQPANWQVRFSSGGSPQPLFTATDPSNNPQPITGPISVAYDTQAGSTTYGKLFLFLGTGSYIFGSDPSDTQVQGWYGIIDDDTPIASRSDLVQRSLNTTGTVSGYDVRTFDTATVGDMVGKKGWVIDLPAGERMVTGSTLYQLAGPTLIASSIIPLDDPCKPGGKGYLNAIDPFTGGATTFVVFDLNDDATFDSQDNLGSEIVGSVDLDVGMPGAPVLVGNQMVVGGSSGKIASLRVNLGGSVTTGRLMWREIIRD